MAIVPKLALSQIVVHQCYGVSFPLLGYPLRSQGVELFGHSEACRFPSFEANHAYVPSRV
jgi:hypothetical protein